MTNKKDQSPLVESILALDGYLSDLSRLGTKIESIEMESDFDFEQTQRHIDLFAQAGESVSKEIVVMAEALNAAREKAEQVAAMVALRAEKLQVRKVEVQAKMAELGALGEAVRDLTLSINDLRRDPGGVPTEEEKAALSMRLTEVDLQIRPLIEKAKFLKKSAQNAKMKVLEQSADSLSQSLTAISQKLNQFQQANQTLN